MQLEEGSWAVLGQGDNASVSLPSLPFSPTGDGTFFSYLKQITALQRTSTLFVDLPSQPHLANIHADIRASLASDRPPFQRIVFVLTVSANMFLKSF